MLMLQFLWAIKQLSNWAELYEGPVNFERFSVFIKNLASDTCVLFHSPYSALCMGNMSLRIETCKPLTSPFPILPNDGTIPDYRQPRRMEHTVRAWDEKLVFICELNVLIKIPTHDGQSEIRHQQTERFATNAATSKFPGIHHPFMHELLIINFHAHNIVASPMGSYSKPPIPI